MANIIDYMEWRGDLTFADSSFNEVDNLILSVLSYIDFSGIIADDMYDESVTLKMAAKRYFEKHKEDWNINPLNTMRNAPAVLQKMSECRRFSNIRLFKYVNHIDTVTQTQFSAITAILDLEYVYVSYRGTDDTLVGWKEDFNMSFMESVPAQLEAVEYAKEVAKVWENKIILGGHSKGGNLAVYAGINIEKSVRNRIVAIYTNDGPGFREELIKSNRFKIMSSKIVSIVPESSLVGMLFYHSEKYAVVKSSKKGFMQHDPLSWEVLGKKFIHLATRSQTSQLMDEAISNWIEGLDSKEREAFTDALFGVLEGANVQTLTEISEQGMKSMPNIIKSYLNLDERTRKMMMEIIKALIQSTDGILKNKREKKLK